MTDARVYRSQLQVVTEPVNPPAAIYRAQMQVVTEPTNPPAAIYRVYFQVVSEVPQLLEGIRNIFINYT